MKRSVILFLAFFALINGLSWSTIINVPGQYPTIQQGIDATVDGDTVLVQPGTYVESINFNGHNIVLGSLFLTTDDTSYIPSTIINGSSSSAKVNFEGNEDSTAVITGFTIGDSAFSSPGGIYCSGSSPTIKNNIIKNNTSSYLVGGGGGIYCSGSSPTIKNNIIKHNYAGYGGGFYCTGGSNPIISHNVISDNIAHRNGADDAKGGGIYCSGGSNATIINNTISNNLAYIFRGFADGGGICSSESSPIISNNLIIDNSTVAESGAGGGICIFGGQPLIKNNIISGNETNYGGGIYCSNSSTIISNNLIIRNIASWWEGSGGGIGIYGGQPLINNNVIFGDSATYGSGIYCYNSGTIIINCIIWSNSILSGQPDSSVISYCDIEQMLPGPGNISADPLFRDTSNGDFHLMSVACGDSIDSPCIDAGDPNIPDGLLDCTRGLGTILSDMGAYGGGDSVQVGIEDRRPQIPLSLALFQNYPNPFNASTSIRYDLPKSCDVSIEIYDILGRKAQTLAREKQQAGHHSVVWNAGGFSSGMYFYKIQAGQYKETKKMLLLK